MHFRKLTAGLGALLMALVAPLFLAPSAHAAVSYSVGVCNPKFPDRCDQSGPFVPDALSTVSLAVTSSTSRVALTGTGATVLITNNGTVDLYVKLGDVTVVAATTDFFVKAGSQLPFARGTATYVAAITASSTSTLIASTGNGTAAGGSGGGGGGGSGGNVTVVGPLGSVAPASGVSVTLDTTDAGNIATIATNSAAALPAGTNTIGAISPLAITPVAGNASVVVTGGTAVNMVIGPIKGGFICNGATAADQGGIAAAETAYVDLVTTATTTGGGTNTPIAAGQCFYLPPGMTTNASVNAATSSHKLSVTKW